MAKKTVATLQTGKEGRSYTKVIKMVKSPKTGAYVFDEQMVPNEKSTGLLQEIIYLLRYKMLNKSSFHLNMEGTFFV